MARIPIALLARSIDSQGRVLLRLGSGTQYSDAARRVERVQTLDGGATTTDGGHSVGDLTLSLDLDAQTTEADIAIIRHLVTAYASVIAITPLGAYYAAPERLSYTGGRGTATFLVTSQIDV
jgi:hypothetical protein